MPSAAPVLAVSPTAVPAMAGWSRLRQWAVIYGCGTLLGLLAADVVQGGFNTGLVPLKPILFSLASAALCLGLSLVSRPRICLPALALLILPVWRALDAEVLQRFELTDISQFAMTVTRTLLLVIAMIAVLSTSEGLRAASVAAVVAILATSGSVIAEALGWIHLTPIPGRYCGFSGHPNAPPMILCEMLGLLFMLKSSFRFNLIMLLICVPGVALTYGRGGMVLLAFMGAGYVALNARRHPLTLLLSVALAIPLIGAGFTLLQSGSRQGLLEDKNISDRLDAIYSLDFEKLKSPERIKDLSDAWEAVRHQPLLGQGVGASGGYWAPHNELISIWLELGLGGLLVFLALHAALILRVLHQRGRGGFALLAIIAFIPLAQGRIDTVHYWLTLTILVHTLWPRRYRLAWQAPTPTAPPRRPSA